MENKNNNKIELEEQRKLYKELWAKSLTDKEGNNVANSYAIRLVVEKLNELAHYHDYTYQFTERELNSYDDKRCGQNKFTPDELEAMCKGYQFKIRLSDIRIDEYIKLQKHLEDQVNKLENNINNLQT